jgi:hypothetical protein
MASSSGDAVAAEEPGPPSPKRRRRRGRREQRLSLAAVAAALGAVKLAVTPDPATGLRGVGRNSLAQACKPGCAAEGRSIWNTAANRRGCPLPLPETASGVVEGSRRPLEIVLCEGLCAAVDKLLGARDAEAFFLAEECLAAAEALARRCGEGAPAEAVEAAAALVRAHTERKRADRADREKQLEAFDVPALGDGDANVQLRTIFMPDLKELFISVHDQLRWLGVDVDGHNEWNHWLKMELETDINKNEEHY